MVVTVAALQDEVQALRDQLREREEEIAARDAKIAQLNALLKQALQREFGTSSEKLPPEQARLFDEPDGEETADPAPIRVQGHERQQRRRPRLSPDLPRVEVVHDLSDTEKICQEHGCALEPLSEVTSEQLEFQPAKLYVLRHIQKTYTCPCCTGQVVTAAKPPSLLPKSLATPGLLAWIVASKFCDGLPLYRQSAIFARLGVTLDRTTMAHWMIRVGAQVQPLVNLLWDRLRTERIVHMDETTVQVLAEPGRTPQSKSYMWVSAAGPPGAGIVLFHYAPSRSGQVAKDLLGDHKGALMVDGYEGYNGVCGSDDITRLGCWAHARRKFVVAQRAQPKGKTGAADQALALIAKLYRIERAQAETEVPERCRARQDQVVPVLKQLRGFLERNQARTAPQTALGKALTYLGNQWPHLLRYVEDGAYPIDNNRAENAIRPFVIGRKNFLFSQSIPGVRANANLYSLIETAKAHGLEPHAYLRQVFERLPHAQSVEDFELLLPGAVKNGV